MEARVWSVEYRSGELAFEIEVSGVRLKGALPRALLEDEIIYPVTESAAVRFFSDNRPQICYALVAQALNASIPDKIRKQLHAAVAPSRVRPPFDRVILVSVAKKIGRSLRPLWGTDFRAAKVVLPNPSATYSGKGVRGGGSRGGRMA
jgi:hypothetical protein